ncbi:MAG: hypothetical protein A2293_03245 [Elusimicrobia bacterium RIFOXYB2_FULL_49_7]|nr:MAG: hypothetical protein A2293_03245 [Elusimicrobia bacterium RIFOXYB2_FULL_49_7]
MKICIPVEKNEGLASKVSGHFGSAAYFAIHDIEGNVTEFVNNENQHHSHGMCQPLSVVGGMKIGAVVCGSMGAMAAAKLNEGGIRAYKATGETLAEIIESYKAGNLEEVTPENACGHHGCH